MLALHDAILADHVLWATALVAVVAAAVVAWRRPSVRRIALSVVAGALLCFGSLAARSTGLSGTLMRTRYGLPHYCAVSRWDPETGRPVGHFRLEVVYLVVDGAFWMMLALVAGAGLPARGHGHARRGPPARAG